MINTKSEILTVRRAAEFSVCAKYRYTLEVEWNPDLPRMLMVLLNPSDATEEHADPTNRRGINFARREKHGSVVFVNEFAWRTKDPKEMKQAEEPVGRYNDTIIKREAFLADTIVVAWGVDGSHLRRDLEVLELLRHYKLLCFGHSMGGYPLHPLYLANETPLMEFKHAPWKGE